MAPQLVAVVGAGLVAGAVLALGAAVNPPVARTTLRGRRRESNLLVAAVLAGLAVLLFTRWPVAAACTVVTVTGWKWLFVSSADADVDRIKLDAIGRWLGDLRDVLHRSSVAIERALEMVAEDSVGVLRDPLARFVLRRRQGVRIPEALVEFADTVAHPTADAAVAALILVVDGGAGGGRLDQTLDELAAATRDEQRARSEIDRLRRMYQRAMRRLVVMTIAFIAGLVAFAPDLLEPYRSVEGQLWLLIPVGMWAGCLVWLRRITSYADEPRYRLQLSKVVT